MNDRWMTVKDVAEYLQLSTDQIYHLAQQGKIPVSKVGSRWRFKRERIDEWMEAQRASGRQQTTGGWEKKVRQYSTPVTKDTPQLTDSHGEFSNHETRSY